MNHFIGRSQEKSDFQAILDEKTSCLVKCQGRRRIGAASSWIEENIRNNMSFLVRCSWHFHLQPLASHERGQFWGRSAPQINNTEYLGFIGVAGGIPRYLEEWNSNQTAEQNVARLCFRRSGIPFSEFENIFHDIQNRTASTHREIVRALVDYAKSIEEISPWIGRERGGSLRLALSELESSGFLAKGIPPSTTQRQKGCESKNPLFSNLL